MTLRTVRLASIVVPVTFMGAASYVVLFHLAEFFATAAGFGLLLVALGLGAWLFSTFTFRTIERLQQRVHQQNKQLLALARIAGVSSENHELSKLLSLSLDEVLEVTGSDAGAICLLDSEAEELVASCHRGLSAPLVRQIQRQKLGAEPMGTEAVRSGKPVQKEAIFAEPEIREAFDREGFAAAISVPLKADNVVSGVLGITRKRPGNYSPEQVELLVNVAAHLGLAVRNSLLLTNSIRRNEELTALLSIAKSSSSTSLDAAIEQTLDAVLEITSADGAEVWLGDSGHGLVLQARRSSNARPLAPNPLAPREGQAVRAMENGVSPRVSDVETGDLAALPQPGTTESQSHDAYPIRARGEMLGVLNVSVTVPGLISDSRRDRLLEGIAEQLAMAVENSRLQARVLDVAVVEERERIARELHDGLAQVLGYITTQSMAVRQHLREARQSQADRCLLAMEDAARSVYADVREAILGLSTTPSVTGHIVPVIEEYINRFRRMVPFAIELDASEDTMSLSIPTSVELQVLRVFQEGLSNVRKHSCASNVRVNLSTDKSALRMTIVDDGAGFDIEQLPQGEGLHFGLRSMRQRAQAMNAALDVSSAPGEGTTLALTVPLNATSGEARLASSPGR